MVTPPDTDRIPEAVPPLPLPEFEFADLEKGERIGTGGDADVYLASIDHDGYTYPVAVKEPRFEGTIRTGVLEKFETETKTWSKLNDHDNIVSVYASGADPIPWLALEYMENGTIESRLGSIDVAEALWLSGRIAEGIRYGHRHGVAHLDIKPANVLLRDTPKGKWNYPKVSDWGLAKMMLEHSNSIDGISPTYAAPEQFDTGEHGSPDDITDIYQLGAVIYALVAGEPPFTGSSTAVMQSVLQEEPAPPSAVNEDIPAAVDEIVLKALEKRKADRYSGVLSLRKELDRVFEEYVSGSSVSTTTTAEADDDHTENTYVTVSGGTDKDNQDSTGEQLQAPDANDSIASQTASTTQQDTTESQSSVLSRRIAVLGVTTVVGGGWLATQMSGGNTEDVGGEQTGPEAAVEQHRTGLTEGDAEVANEVIYRSGDISLRENIEPVESEVQNYEINEVSLEEYASQTGQRVSESQVTEFIDNSLSDTGGSEFTVVRWKETLVSEQGDEYSFERYYIIHNIDGKWLLVDILQEGLLDGSIEALTQFNQAYYNKNTDKVNQLLWQESQYYPLENIEITDNYYENSEYEVSVSQKTEANKGDDIMGRDGIMRRYPEVNEVVFYQWSARRKSGDTGGGVSETYVLLMIDDEWKVALEEEFNMN